MRVFVLAVLCAGCLSVEFVSTGGGGAGGIGGEPEGGAPAEDCFNGVDDDADGDIDCQDSDCTTSVCIEVPVGWEGPVALSVPGGDCHADFSGVAGTGIMNIEAVAASCLCDCVKDGADTCGNATIAVFNTNDCSGAPQGSFDLAGTCLGAISGASMVASITTSVAPVVPAECTATLDEGHPRPTVEDRRLCRGAEGAPCGDGTCAAPPGEGFEPRLCIHTPGMATCPGGDFTQLFVLYEDGFEDQRSCDPCICTPQGGACDTTVFVYSSTNCTGAASGAATEQQCGQVTPAGIASANATLTPPPGSCAISGGAAHGEVVGLGPRTVCCSVPL